MKFIKFLLILLVTLVVSPTLNGGEEMTSLCSIEELLEDIHSKFRSVEKEFEDEVVLTNSTRRSTNQNESNAIFETLCPFKYPKMVFPNSKEKLFQRFDVYLSQNEEISFLHRFQLY